MCPICAYKTDEERLLQEVTEIRDSRDQLAALRSNYTNPLSSRDIEVIEDQIVERETNLQFTVNRALWSLYRRDGEEGVRSQQAAREVEEAERLERTYIQVMRREWYSQRFASEETVREQINDDVAAGSIFGIQRLIDEAQTVIRRHETGPRGEDLVAEERDRLDAEFARERLQVLHAGMAEIETADPSETEIHRAAARRRTVEGLEIRIALREWTLAGWWGSTGSRTGHSRAYCDRYDGLLRDMVGWQNEVDRLRAEGLGDPMEQDIEPGEV